MSFPAGSITSDLLLNTSGFSGGVTRAIASANMLKSSVLSLAAPLAAIAGIGGMGMMLNAAKESIDATGKLSDRLGMATETIVGMQHAAGLAGVSNEELTTAWERMLNVAGEAASKGGEAAKSLEAVGISGERLKGMTTDELFTQIAQSLSEMTDPAQRASVAMDLFGRSGQRLLPMMMSGAEGIAAAKAEAEKLGISFSRVDAAKVEAANDALTKVQEIFTGIAQQVVIELAPYVDALAVKFTDVATAGGGMGSIVSAAIEGVATGIAYAADILNLFKAGWNVLQVGAAGVVWAIVGYLEQLAETFDWVYEKMTGKKSGLAEGLGQIRQGLVEGMKADADEAAQAWDDFSQGKNRKAVTAFFDDVNAKSQAAAQGVADNAAKMKGALGSLVDTQPDLSKVVAELEKMRIEMAQAGMTDAQKKLDDLKRMGANDTQMGEAKEILDKMEKIQAMDEMKKSAEQWAKTLETPADKWQEQITELNKLLLNGAISQEMFDRGLEYANKELDKASNPVKKEKSQGLAGLIQGGGAEAAKYQAELAVMMRGGGQEQVAKDQLTVQKKMEEHLGKMVAGDGPVADISGGLA
jgi:hypothetical protein